MEDVDHGDDDVVHVEDALLEHQSSTLLSAEPTPTARFFKQDFQKPHCKKACMERRDSETPSFQLTESIKHIQTPILLEQGSP